MISQSVEDKITDKTDLQLGNYNSYDMDFVSYDVICLQPLFASSDLCML